MSYHEYLISFMHRRRRAIVWLCIAAALLLGVRAQLHGLSHALQAVQASAHKDALAAHAQACDQCLQFAALDGAAPLHWAAPLSLACDAGECALHVAPLRAAAFAAYISRAPPQLG
jgi:hypothetical protein